jgi:MraZ protein
MSCLLVFPKKLLTICIIFGGDRWGIVGIPIYLHLQISLAAMTILHGEYECRIDDKGRIILPAGLKKQIPPEAQEKFVINRGFENCLTMYPMNEWIEVSRDVNQLNLFVKDHRIFARNFNRGATELQLDASNRVLIPKTLLEYARIQKDLILSAFSNRIEVWAKEEYEQHLKMSDEEYANLAEKVMGKLQKPEEPENVS